MSISQMERGQGAYIGIGINWYRNILFPRSKQKQHLITWFSQSCNKKKGKRMNQMVPSTNKYLIFYIFVFHFVLYEL